MSGLWAAIFSFANLQGFILYNTEHTYPRYYCSSMLQVYCKSDCLFYGGHVNTSYYVLNS